MPLCKGSQPPGSVLSWAWVLYLYPKPGPCRFGNPEAGGHLSQRMYHTCRSSVPDRFMLGWLPFPWSCIFPSKIPADGQFISAVPYVLDQMCDAAPKGFGDVRSCENRCLQVILRIRNENSRALTELCAAEWLVVCSFEIGG